MIWISLQCKMNQFPCLTSRIQGLSSQSRPCWASQLSDTSPSLQKVLVRSADSDTHGFWNYCAEIAGVQKSGESCFPLPLAPARHRNWGPCTPLSVCPASQSKKQTQFNISSQMPTRGHSHTPENTERSVQGSRYISIQCWTRGNKRVESEDLYDRIYVNSPIPTCESVHN